MATTGMRVTGAVSATSSATSGTLYTAPANSYAIIQVYWSSATNGRSISISVATRPVWFATYTTTDGILISSAPSKTLGGSMSQASVHSIYVGPGQALSFSQTAADNVAVSGVQFGP